MSDTEEIPPRNHPPPLPKEPLWVSLLMLVWFVVTMAAGIWWELKTLVHLFR